jgi:hypothetical protein
MRGKHAVLVEQRQPARAFQNALDHEHHVRAASIVFVEHQRDVVLIGPRQDAFAELGDLLAVLDDDGVLANQVDTRDVAVQVDADQRPVEAGGNLFDVGRFAGAVKAGDHHAAVVGKACQNGQRGLGVEQVILVELRHVLVRLAVGRYLQVAVNSEELAYRNGLVGQARYVGLGLGIHG